jgi:hypothetical protein
VRTCERECSCTTSDLVFVCGCEVNRALTELLESVTRVLLRNQLYTHILQCLIITKQIENGYTRTFHIHNINTNTYATQRHDEYVCMCVCVCGGGGVSSPDRVRGGTANHDSRCVDRSHSVHTHAYKCMYMMIRAFPCHIERVDGWGARTNTNRVIEVEPIVQIADPKQVAIRHNIGVKGKRTYLLRRMQRDACVCHEKSLDVLVFEDGVRGLFMSLMFVRELDSIADVVIVRITARHLHITHPATSTP